MLKHLVTAPTGLTTIPGTYVETDLTRTPISLIEMTDPSPKVQHKRLQIDHAGPIPNPIYVYSHPTPMTEAGIGVL